MPPDFLDPSKTVGILAACYSVHPIVGELKKLTTVPVLGIFESSIAAALLLLGTDERFGIVSTGKVWERLLSDGVKNYLGTESDKRFAGVETTGLNAVELEHASDVKTRMIEATRRLLRKGKVGAVCLGCAGMVGMEDWVKEAAIAELGAEQGSRIRIVDGVKVGFVMLEGLVKARV